MDIPRSLLETEYEDHQETHMPIMIGMCLSTSILKDIMALWGQSMQVTDQKPPALAAVTSWSPHWF